jgi:uroporphyrinogen decarboxylase
MRFVPVVYEHAAALINRRPYEVAFDSSLLASAHAEAFRRYRHSPVVVGIDVYNVEAEAYGAVLQDAGGISIPSIEKRLCGGIDDMFNLRPIDLHRDGRFPMLLEAAARLKKECPGAPVVLPLSGPFSIAQNLMGMEELLFAVLSDPERARDALMVIARHVGDLIVAATAVGLAVIVFESSASPPLLSPALFRKAEAPALSHLGRIHHEAVGKGIALILGGNTLPVLPDLIQVGAGSIICPAEVDGVSFLNTMRAHPDVEVRINMRPGGFATSLEDATSEAERALALAAGRSNVCIGSGVLPYDANPEIVLNIQSFIEGRPQ